MEENTVFLCYGKDHLEIEKIDDVRERQNVQMSKYLSK